ncbi:peptide deformylase [Swaminathania salitolerans]|uniref:Peptide deformylase n=1 Tax=Swaminathania salitolerans TaxID=182838 RepID=A0A511BPF7_9PROT|nr:peptide deformylase [Swaminathania salitolerans]GBQ10873.1 peptide deformylase [Swaminathania salitolerans LMG 21291]GEL02210.1 peptide deformylase [Swaminathania salitolerans]
MALLKIARMGHPVLLQKAQPVEDIHSSAIRQLVSDMIETMLDARGAGLAAPQVHKSLRLFVYQVPEPRCAPGEAPIPPGVLINPELAPVGDAMMMCQEGCLSLPELRGSVPRHAEIAFRGFDLEGAPVSGIARGFHANVLQHEQDHLDGILYPMRMTDFTTFGYASEFPVLRAGEG